MEYIPNIIRQRDWIIFQISEKNSTLIKARGETLTSLEGAYNDIQDAYEQGKINPGKYLQWVNILYKKGLEIDKADREKLGLLSKLKQKADKDVA